MNGIIININLKGRLEGPVKHVDTEIVRANVAEINQKSFYKDVEINHTSRKESPCIKKCTIDEDTVSFWTSDVVPIWSDQKTWKRLTKDQKLSKYVERFDEGYGVSFEYIN